MKNEYIALHHSLRLMRNEYNRMKTEYENFPDYLINEIEFFEEYLEDLSQQIITMEGLLTSYK